MRCRIKIRIPRCTVWEVLYRLTIVISKNIGVWKRRHLTVLLELCTPVLVASLLAYINTDKSVFRSIKLEELEANRHTSVNQSKGSFYDLGADFTEANILRFTLCKDEHATCYIGYVADDVTVGAIFENDVFLNTSNFRKPVIWKPRGNYTNGTVFMRFADEESILKCLEEPDNCTQFNRQRRSLLFFRGAVVFETGLKDQEIKYKIRLLEKQYNDLRHVLKTSRIRPTLFDKREFVKSYLASGFLSLQYHIDRMIVTHFASGGAQDKMFEKIADLKEKVTLYEMPHRHLDQFHYSDEAHTNIDIEDINDDGKLGTSNINDLSEPERAQRAQLGSIALILSFTFLIPFELRRIIEEKQTGLTSLLMVTGMTHRMQWIGNLFAAILIYILPVTVMAILLTVRFNSKIGAAFELVTPFVLWLLFLLYIAAMTSVCSVFSVFFNKPVVAMTAATIILVVAFIAPYYHVELLYNETPARTKLLFCIHPSIAFQIALTLLIRYEDLASETNILTIGNVIPTDTMRLIYIILILFTESCFFMILAIYLDRVYSSNTGAKMPWYYLCLPSQYTGGGGKQQSRVFPGTLPRPPPSSIEAQSKAVPTAPALNYSKTANSVSPVVGSTINPVTVADGPRRKSVVINVGEQEKLEGEDGKPSTTPGTSDERSLKPDMKLKDNKNSTGMTDSPSSTKLVNAGDNKDDNQSRKTLGDLPSQTPSEKGNSSAAEEMVVKRSLRAQPSAMADGYEPCREDEEPSVVTFNLTKKYGKTVAVKDLNIKLFHGEIFALLGHNGAGKSTTLNLFSGYVAPTSGAAKIYGYNLKTHMIQIQSFTGMCPQTSALFNDLTPLEHLLIFGRLRGLRGSDAKEEATELIEKLNLAEASNQLACQLSKGDSRKLSLAVALIGNPKVVILDEPTGGMDYYSRRAVWDLLLKIRPNHTIIFSTHFMDEAELLGDKIGIMVNGKMEVMGSHHFLRHHLNVGYSLKMTVDPTKKPDSQAILGLVQQTMPNATLTTLRTNPNADHVCNVNLPDEGYSANAMSVLFSYLAEKKESLGIVGFSVSHATVDEVFLALMRKLSPEDEDVNQVEEVHEGSNRHHRKVSGLTQFWVLLKKRAYFSMRKKTILFVQVVLPIVAMCVGIMRLYSSIEVDGRNGPALILTLDSYTKPRTLFYPSVNFPEDIIRSVFGKSAVNTPHADIAGGFIEAKYSEHRQLHVLAMSPDTGDDKRILMYFSPYFIHTAPLALNAYFNIQIKRIDMAKTITTTNHPFSHPYFTGPYFGDDPQAVDIYASLCTVAFTLMLTLCIVFPMEERISRIKHLQFMAGVSPVSYWLVILICDILCIMIAGSIGIKIFYSVYPPARFITSFPEDRTTEVRFLIFIAQAYCSSSMMHLFSHFTHSPAGGFSLFLSISILFGMLIPYFTVSTIQGISLLGTTEIGLFLRINPFHGTSVIFRKLANTLLQNGKCNYFTKLGEKHYCDEDLTAEEVKELYQVSCCRNCYKIPGATNCYDRYEILAHPWSTRNYSYQEYIEETPSPVHNLKSVASNSIFYELVFSFVIGIIFQSLAMFLDTDSYKYLLACVFGMRGRAFQTDVDDDDVNNEMDRVEEMVETGELSSDLLVAYNLCKTFGIFPVVHNVSFGVQPGECFGILGVNGAGKSTLFKLLTGTIVETFGNVYSDDCSLTHGRKRLMMKMGYLPHGKLAIGYMTPLEHLHLFCSLRGQSELESKKDIDQLLKKLHLQPYKNTRILGLSGGIQQRVCTALALVAQLPIILLDEPTSSSDPVARSYFWEVIKDAKKAGQTVIFNSHRIFECEELCDRVGILIDGKFQCIGSPTHLKHKFGIGFKLLIKLVPGHSDNQEYVSSLSNTVVEIFYPCSLRDRRRNVIQYVIHDSEISWDYLFQQMEHIHLRYTDLVEDYSFSETTLEEVFLQFVIQQHCGRIKRQFGHCCPC